MHIVEYGSLLEKVTEVESVTRSSKNAGPSFKLDVGQKKNENADDSKEVCEESDVKRSIMMKT